MSKKRSRHDGVYHFWNTSDGARLSYHRQRGSRSDLPGGCGVATLTFAQLQSLRELCGKIKENTAKFVAWGDGFYDNKERGYAMVPELSAWKSVDAIIEAGILLHDVDSAESNDKAIRMEAAKKHRLTRDKAFTSISPSAAEVEALEAVVALAAEIVNQCDAAEPLQPYEKASVSLQNLVAIQPNFHNGDDYLPLHVDNPRHDGFGVVIVTVALWGSADVVLVDDGDAEEEDEDAAEAEAVGAGLSDSPADSAGPDSEPVATGLKKEQCGAQGSCEDPGARGSRSWVFELHPGQLYVLSGHARNKCAHGVVMLPTDAGSGAEQAAEQVAERIDVPPGKRAAATTGDNRKGSHKAAGAGDGTGLSRRGPRSGTGADRVSLNLRFGLHTAEQAHQDIDRHWG